jgi:hypothetical protein
MTVFNRNAANLAHLLTKASKIREMKILKMFVNASLRPLKIYIFRKFQKYLSSNQLKYLMGFRNVSSHHKKPLLRKRFSYKFKYWTAYNC